MRNDFYVGCFNDPNYMAHHGILGMHWGKRNGPPYPLDAADHSKSEKAAGYKKSLGGGRNESLYDRKTKKVAKSVTTKKPSEKKTSISKYTNPDGTINEAGKKKFFSKNEHGWYVINQNGYDFNNKQKASAERYAKAVAANVKKNPEFKKAYEDYKQANLKNNEHFIAEREKWFRQEGEYKGKDYYQFKDISAHKWFNSKDAQNEKQAREKLERLVKDAAKEHPLYNKSFYQIPGYNYVEGYSNIAKQNAGEYATNYAIQMLRWEIAKEHKK